MGLMTSMAELYLFYTRPARLDLCRALAEEALRHRLTVPQPAVRELGHQQAGRRRAPP